MIEPDELLGKALDDAFVAGRSKQSFKTFKREWVKLNLRRCKGCGHVLPLRFFDDDKNRCYMCDVPI